MTAAIMGQNNPYIIGIPIDEPKCFFGREDIFQFIEDNLKQNAKVILLYGQRRIGKSSVLSQVRNFVQLEQFFFVILSLEGKSQKTLSEILHEIAVEVREYLEDELELELDHITPPSPQDLQQDQKLFSDHFLKQVFEVIEGKNIVFLIDEFDVLGEHSQGTASTHFFPYLKSLIDEQEKLFIIPVVGRQLDDMPNLLNLFHQAPHQRIGLLSERNAKRLITKPAKDVLEYNSDAIQAILELSSGHPYLTQVICFALFSKARDEGQPRVTREDVDSVVDKAIEIGEGGLAWFYDGLPIPERVIFSAVAEAQKIAAQKAEFAVEEPLTLLRNYGVIQTKSLVQAAESLVKWGFLDVAEASGLPRKTASPYKVKIELVRRWLVKRHPLLQEIRELWESQIPIIVNYYYHRDFNVTGITSVDISVDDNLPCPYQGLYHFGPEEAEYFFGREVFVEQLYQYTETRNFIPVIGASGSGKSSVILAGLVPQLFKAGHWKFTYFRPGKDPFQALAQALIQLYALNLNATELIIQARKLAGCFQNNTVPLSDVLKTIHRNYPQDRILLIADQFEELYTFCSDELTRRQFLDTLLETFYAFAEASSLSIVLVVTMRADFLGNFLSYRPIADVLQQGNILLGPMNLEELRDVIEKPAQKLGVTFQSGLVERILDDLSKEPGKLPLLELTLTELWKKQKGKQLIHNAYEEIGEVSGALTRYADEKFSQLTLEEKQQARRIFMQLVRPGNGTGDTRRVATKAEFNESNWSLVKKLADLRLVVTSYSVFIHETADNSQLKPENIEEQETVELIHEVLVRDWGQLRNWMETDREFRVWQERLRQLMRQWEEMNQDNGLLLRGAALVQAEERLKERHEELSNSEIEFIQMSLAKQKQELRKQQLVLRSFGSISAILVSLLGFASWQWQQAETAKIRIYSLNGAEQFASNQQLEGLIASLRSAKDFQGLFWENSELKNQVQDTLQTIVDEIQERNQLEGNQGGVNSVSFSPDGKFLASGGENGTVHLWNLQGEQLASLTGNQGGVNSVSFSPDSKFLASGGENGTVNLWNLKGQLVWAFNVPKGEVNNVSFSPDGKLLATAGADGTGRLWDLNSRQQLEEFKMPQGMINTVSFSPDGQLLATAGDDGTIRLWSLQNQQLSVSTENQLDELLIRGCNWGHDYLKNNPNVSESDRTLCNGIN